MLEGKSKHAATLVGLGNWDARENGVQDLPLASNEANACVDGGVDVGKQLRVLISDGGGGVWWEGGAGGGGGGDHGKRNKRAGGRRGSGRDSDERQGGFNLMGI